MSEKLETIIRMWSSDRGDFFKDQEAFIKKHREGGATSITYDNESGCPVSATYVFAPWSVYIDNMLVLEQIAQERGEAEKGEGHWSDCWSGTFLQRKAEKGEE